MPVVERRVEDFWEECSTTVIRSLQLERVLMMYFEQNVDGFDEEEREWERRVVEKEDGRWWRGY